MLLNLVNKLCYENEKNNNNIKIKIIINEMTKIAKIAKIHLHVKNLATFTTNLGRLGTK